MLTEATRKELIDKSKSADKTKSYGTTRYDRRNYQHIYNSLNAFNKIDMNALYKANLLSFKVPVHGETDNYTVEILFEGICDDMRHEIHRNKDVLEYKCIYRALVNAINRQDIYVACTCPDWQYRFAYWANKNGYNGGRPELRVADITNPGDTKGAGCKHVMAVLANLDWALKLATTIYNYIIYMEEHYESKFASVMFPKLFDMSYQEYKDKIIISADDELADTMDNEEDEEEIDKANVYGTSKYTPTRDDVEYAREEPEEEE